MLERGPVSLQGCRLLFGVRARLRQREFQALLGVVVVLSP